MHFSVSIAFVLILSRFIVFAPVSVESVGVLAPKRIFRSSVAILKSKCDYLLRALDTIASAAGDAQ